MAPVVHEMFEFRADRYFDTNIVSLGVLPSIWEALLCMIFLIILTRGIMPQVSRPILHGKPL